MKESQNTELESSRYANLFLDCPKFSQEFKVISKIGKGSTSNVYQVISRKDGTEYAVKAYNHMKLKSILTRQAVVDWRGSIVDKAQKLVTGGSVSAYSRVLPSYPREERDFRAA